MYEKKKQSFDPSHFITLLKGAGLSCQDLVQITQIPEHRIVDFHLGRDVPLDVLIALARYFNVSTDFLLGLDDDTEKEDAFHAFSIRRQMEASTLTDPTRSSADLRRDGHPSYGSSYRGIVAGWPYNLIDAIDAFRSYYRRDPHPDRYIPIPLTDDQMAGLEYAVGTLDEQEQRVIRCRFIDGLTMSDTAERLSISMQAAKAAEVRAVRKLRYPARRNLILNGLKGSGFLSRMGRTDLLEAEYQERLDMPVEELDLSIRPYGGLRRAGIRTVYDIVVRIAESAKHPSKSLSTIRNIGVKAENEISMQLKDHFGFSEEEIFLAASLGISEEMPIKDLLKRLLKEKPEENQTEKKDEDEN